MLINTQIFFSELEYIPSVIFKANGALHEEEVCCLGMRRIQEVKVSDILSVLLHSFLIFSKDVWNCL